MTNIHAAAEEMQRDAELHCGPSAPAIPKMPKVARTDKLKAAARKYPCVLCHREGYTVAAHCNDAVFKGIGKKAPDWMIAYVCGDPGGCHDKIDGRAGGLTLEAKRALWDRAFKLTVNLWFRDGWVRVG